MKEKLCRMNGKIQKPTRKYLLENIYILKLYLPCKINTLQLQKALKHEIETEK